MPSARIEHINITVSDPGRSAELLSAIFGWRERWRGPSRDNGFTIHVGSDTDYIALYTGADAEHADAHWDKGVPLNHIGVEVEDLAETEARVVAAGLTPFSHGDYAPGKRFYFLDHDGVEWEAISYR